MPDGIRMEKILMDGLQYGYYLFDFDGTLADTGEGIRKSVAYSLERMGREVPAEAELNRFIGPPLHDSYMRVCGMTEAEAEQAVAIYRERYTDVGIYEAHVYPGIAQLLRALRQSGAYVAVASAKPEVMVRKIIAHFGLDTYLNAIVGVSLDRREADKRDLILAALPADADPACACMVGDRCFDIDAAKALGLYAVGAGYGYGPDGELEASGADRIYDSVAAMTEGLLGKQPRGLFISLEGSDGCGKSTQIRLLNEYLIKRGFETVLTREPGGCPISERIREVLLSLESTGMSGTCEALLYAASRVEHVRKVIRPALNCGKIVICDRFLDSSIAYQAYGRELGEAFIRQINAPAVEEAYPDLTVLLEIDRASACARVARSGPLDRLEREQEDFFQRVQAGFNAVALAEPARISRIDAGRPVESVFEAIRACIEGALAV